MEKLILEQGWSNMLPAKNSVRKPWIFHTLLIVMMLFAITASSATSVGLQTKSTSQKGINL